MILQIVCVFIGNANSIRVVNDKDENGTTTAPTSTTAKLETPQVATASNLPDTNQTNDTLMHKSGYDNPMKMRYVLIRFPPSSHLNMHEYEYECHFNSISDAYFN